MSPVRPAHILLMLAGFAVWASALTLLYALLSAGCALGWNTAALRIALLMTWGVHLAAGGALVWFAFIKRAHWRGQDAPAPFLRTVILAANAAAFMATSVTGFPVVFASICL